MPIYLNISMVLGVYPIARGWGELPLCFSTRIIGTPREDKHAAAMSPLMLPPTISTEVEFADII